MDGPGWPIMNDPIHHSFWTNIIYYYLNIIIQIDGKNLCETEVYRIQWTQIEYKYNFLYMLIGRVKYGYWYSYYSKGKNTHVNKGHDGWYVKVRYKYYLLYLLVEHSRHENWHLCCHFYNPIIIFAFLKYHFILVQEKNEAIVTMRL